MQCIAYVNYLQDVSQLSGVMHVLENKCQAIQSEGLPMRVFLFTCSKISHPGITVISIPKHLGGWGRYRWMAKEISFKCKDFDVVILRKMTYSPVLYWHLRKKSFKLIVEYHTLHLRLNQLSGRLFTYLLERFSGHLMMSLIAGKIVMTQEIGENERNTYGDSVPIKMIPNGVLRQHIEEGRMLSFDGKKLSMVFVASQYHLYHGIERLLSGLAIYSGPVAIELHIVGLSEVDFPSHSLTLLKKAQSCATISLHPKLRRPELKSLYAKCHLGIGTLALHQLPMREACSLKVREYMRYGLPFIFSGIDSELKGDEPFCLPFTDDQSPLEIEKIIDFVQRVSNQYAGVLAALSNFLEATSLEIKMTDYCQFAGELSDSGGQSSTTPLKQLEGGEN